MMTLGFFFLNCTGDGVVTASALYQGLAKFIKLRWYFSAHA
jgi:hypothetical protein